MAAKPARALDPRFFLEKINGGKTRRDYKDKQAIFSQGDVANAVFYVDSGKVKLTVVSKRGKEAVIAMVEPGNFFGEGCMAGQPLRMSTAKAMQKATVIRIDKKTMVGVLHQEPEFAGLFTAYLLSRNIRIEEDLVDQLFNSSEKRLARILLLLAHYGKEPKQDAIIPNIRQEMLAEMIGTTRSRVSFFLNKFRDLGFIEYNGSLHVHSSLVSVVLHD